MVTRTPNKITKKHLYILSIIADLINEGLPVTPHEIASRTEETSQAVTHTLRILVRFGLIEHVYTISPEGKKHVPSLTRARAGDIIFNE